MGKDSTLTLSRSIDVLVPGLMSPVRGALSSCAIEGNRFAIDALETIRRVEHGEPVGTAYVTRLNDFFMNRPAPRQ